MKKSIIYLALLTLLGFIVFTGCGTFTQEVWLEEDGSGKMNTTYDMTPLFGMTDKIFEGMMEESDSVGWEISDESDEDEYEDSTEDDNNFGFLPAIDSLFASGEFTEMDTIINLYEVMPDSVKEKLSNPELAKKLELGIQVMEEEQTAFLTIRIQFDYPEQIKETLELFTELESLKPEEDDTQQMEFQFTSFSYDKNMGLITVEKQEVEEAGTEDLDYENLQEEEKAFIDEMFGDMKIKNIWHLPFDIKEVSLPSVMINGKTATLETDMLEMLKAGGIAGYTIKMKQ